MLYWVRGENAWTLNLSIHDGCAHRSRATATLKRKMCQNDKWPHFSLGNLPPSIRTCVLSVGVPMTIHNAAMTWEKQKVAGNPPPTQVVNGRQKETPNHPRPSIAQALQPSPDGVPNMINEKRTALR